MVTGYEFTKGPWQDVAWLVAKTQSFYDKYVTPDTGETMASTTKRELIQARRWAPSRMLWDKNFDALREELDIMYVPKQIDPGPCILFPQRDYHGNQTYGKIRPFYPLMMKHGPVKYGFVGNAEMISGPTWFGTTDQTFLNIAKYRSVALVEGYFDLMAARLLVPDAPVLSTGLKSINEMHVHYMHMLGVKTVHLMFDNDPPVPPHTMGPGQQAMLALRKTWDGRFGMTFKAHTLPGNDPSFCLESYESALMMRDMLQGIFTPYS